MVNLLALQTDSGIWLDNPGAVPLSYLELDALYALHYMQKLVPGYRKGDVDAALDRYAAATDAWWTAHQDYAYTWDPHRVLAAIGCFGLLQQFRPEDYPDTNTWTDIFTHKPFYDTAAVEVLPK
jgi:hypothetical protein